MNNKYKIATLSLSGALVVIFVMMLLTGSSKNVNCTGTLTMNSPGKNEYTFNGTVSVKINSEGDSKISIFGKSLSNTNNDLDHIHFVNRDITFKVVNRIKNDYVVDNIKSITHPEDNMNDNEYSGFIFDIFDLDNNIITVRQFSNSYIFGDMPIPSFICVKKK